MANRILALVLTLGFCSQLVALSYFAWAHSKQNKLLEALVSKLEKSSLYGQNTLPSTDTRHRRDQRVAAGISAQLSSENVHDIIRFELAELQKQVSNTLSDNLRSNKSAGNAPKSDIDMNSVLDANHNIEELYNDAITSGQWSDQNRTQLLKNLHMASEDKRNDLLDKLIIAINSGEITTDGQPLF